MANRLMGITIDCADPARLAAFWSQLLDMAVTGEHGDDTGWATVGSRLDDRPRLTFQQVAEPKTAKVRIHLDVQVDDIATARKHVESLGGRWSGERHYYDDGGGYRLAVLSIVAESLNACAAAVRSSSRPLSSRRRPAVRCR